MGVDDPEGCATNSDCTLVAGYVGWDAANTDNNFGLVWGTEGPTFTTLLRTLDINVDWLDSVSFLADFLAVKITPLNDGDDCDVDSLDGATMSLEDLRACYFVMWAAPLGAFPTTLGEFPAQGMIDAIDTATGGSAFGFIGTLSVGAGDLAVSADIEAWMQKPTLATETILHVPQPVLSTRLHFALGVDLFGGFFYGDIEVDFDGAVSMLNPLSPVPVQSSLSVSASVQFVWSKIADIILAMINIADENGDCAMSRADGTAIGGDIECDMLGIGKVVNQIDAIISQSGVQFCRKLGVPKALCKLMGGALDALVTAAKALFEIAKTALVAVGTQVADFLRELDPIESSLELGYAFDVDAGTASVIFQWEGGGLSVGFSFEAGAGEMAKVAESMATSLFDEAADLVGVSLGSVAAMLSRPIKQQKKKFRSAMKQGFSAASGAASGIMGHLGALWDGATDFASFVTGGSGDSECGAVRSFGFKKCRNCQANADSLGDGAGDARLILKGEREVGRAKCFSACLEVSTQIYDAWVETTVFDGRVLGGDSAACDENFVATIATTDCAGANDCTSCEQRCTEDVFCEGYVLKGASCYFLKSCWNTLQDSDACDTEADCHYWRTSGFEMSGPLGPPTQEDIPGVGCHEARCARGASCAPTCSVDSSQNMFKCCGSSPASEAENTLLGKPADYSWKEDTADVCTGVYGSGCLFTADWATANATCIDAGQRLCTMEELDGGCTSTDACSSGQLAWSSDAGSLVLQSVALNPVTGTFDHEHAAHADFKHSVYDWTVGSCCRFEQPTDGQNGFSKCSISPGTGRNVKSDAEDIMATGDVVCNALGADGDDSGFSGCPPYVAGATCGADNQCADVVTSHGTFPAVCKDDMCKIECDSHSNQCPFLTDNFGADGDEF
jgi:hypothetical protein